jgi:pyruvate dehydrogenase E2 component (dihydrolipoamide acetyltransferase)
MPKFGLTMQEGTLQRCFKTPGEAVSANEPLYEVETEKVLYIVEAPSPGTLAAWLHSEGETIECGGLVAVIAEPGEDVSAITARYANGAPTHRAAASSPSPATSPSAAEADSSGADGAAAKGRRAASPVARKLAAELGVDLTSVAGTGPGGRITREDVEQAAQPARNDTAPAVATTGKPQVHTVPMRGMRKTIATRMHQSLRDTAQLTIHSEADVTAATELRARMGREHDFTYTDMIIHAVSRALLRHPRMNSRLSEEAILMLSEVNIGMAVALDEGLIVPVIREAHRKSLREIAIATRDLGERARSGGLKLDDVSGGTFTVTNLGTWGVDGFTPILNVGETGILGVGRIVEKPAIYSGEIARRSTVMLSLTFDHRVIDGAPAAAFLQTVVDILNYGER